MAKNKKVDDSVKTALAALLGLSKGARFDSEAVEGLAFRPDVSIRDGDTLYLVEVKNASTVETLSQLALMKGLTTGRNIRYVLAAKYVPSSVYAAAKKLGVKVVTLPSGVHVSDGRKGGLTTEKAWRAVMRLLASRATSIRKIAIEEKLSYGWAHTTVRRLVDAGVAAQRGAVVEVASVQALLNAVAWERPFEDMRLGEIQTSYDRVSDAVEALTNSAVKFKQPLAFGGLTAATLYSGYGAMHDAGHCYIGGKETMELMRDGLQGDGVTIHFYKPDRNVFKDARVRDGAMLVTPGQALLDVAGMGYKARDVALDMARRFGEIAANSL
jgi:DNA-binding Lrp family transcriptional regulator